MSGELVPQNGDNSKSGVSKHRLTPYQRERLETLIKEANLTDTQIAAQVGCGRQTVIRARKKLSIKAPSRWSRVAQRTIDKAEKIANKASEALSRKSDEAWNKTTIPQLADVFSRQAHLILKQTELERAREAPPPTYQPNPIYTLLAGVFAGALAGHRGALYNKDNGIRQAGDKATWVEAAQEAEGDNG